ncbi:hypothetical protein ACFYMX_15730 [Streptomyces griseofuscus]|uniref:hypothetical protein n=1 Tax=Streptomyces griseofuscus TaxID=146922 RepID=UPI003675AAE7
MSCERSRTSWCAERGYDGPAVPAWAKRMPSPDSEVPASPVELADVIDSLRSTASTVRETGDRMILLARIVDGDVPLATRFRDQV